MQMVKNCIVHDGEIDRETEEGESGETEREIEQGTQDISKTVNGTTGEHAWTVSQMEEVKTVERA